MILVALFLAQSSAIVQNGARIFAQSCSVGYCHGAAGAAGRGPRLRGRTFEESYLIDVVRDGIPRSAMPAWRGRLSEADILAVVRYVESLSNVSATDAASAETNQAETTKPTANDRPAQVERGRALFFDATRETSCGTCHELDDRGIAVGPDLRKVVKESPREIVATLRGGEPNHFVMAITTDNERFPAVIVSDDPTFVKLYDLTAPLPVLRTLSRSHIKSRKPATGWNHSAYLQGIGPAQMEDLIAYLRWIRNGISKRGLR